MSDFVERDPAYVAVMRNILGRVEAGVIAGASSVITLREVLVKPGQARLAALGDAYREILLHSRNFALLLIDSDIADRASDLRVRYGLRTPDALELAAALSGGSQAFLMNDRRLQRVTEIRVLLLGDLEL